MKVEVMLQDILNLKIFVQVHFLFFIVRGWLILTIKISNLYMAFPTPHSILWTLVFYQLFKHLLKSCLWIQRVHRPGGKQLSRHTDNVMRGELGRSEDRGLGDPQEEKPFLSVLIKSYLLYILALWSLTPR